MMILVGVVIGILLHSVQGVAVPSSNLILHEKRHAPPAQWNKRDRMPPNVILPVRIGLMQNNLEKGHDYLMDVSHPTSANYGKHWTSDEVHDMFAPSEKTVTAVRNWLISSGIAEERIAHSGNKGWLAFDATTEEMENLLHTEYYEFEHSSADRVAVASDEYHVPSHIREHVDFVTPGIKLITRSKKELPKRSKRQGRGLSTSITDNARRSPQPGGGIPSSNTYSAKVSPQLEQVSGKDSTSLARPFAPSSLSNVSGCDTLITPACIASLYKIPQATKAHPDNAMGIWEEGDFYDQEDLNLFFAKYARNIPQGFHPIANYIDGAEAPGDVAGAGAESTMDFELAYPLLYPQNIVLYQTDDINYATQHPTAGSFNTFLDAIDGSYCTYSAFGETGDDPILDPIYPDPAADGYKGKLMCGVYKPANVISTSYLETEANLPEAYMERHCNEYMKLGLQGHTFLYSSGDFGVGGPSGCLGEDQTVFNPQFPVNCPYVTAVGATKILPGHTVNEPESAANDPINHPFPSAYSSGGGFSNVHPAPDYQLRAVASYFTEHNPPYPYYEGKAPLGKGGSGVYNRIGRGVPDVSANGDNIAVFLQGKPAVNGGTSAATPIFASIINLINEERLAIGKSPVGFINPVIYENPWIFTDITNGSNPNCGTAGFSAVPGWDPITGLGTPIYPKMLDLFLSLP